MIAAAGKQNDGNNNQPKGAVVKQIAKTVIHNRSSIKSSREAMGLLCYHIMTKDGKCASKVSVFVGFAKNFSILQRF